MFLKISNADIQFNQNGTPYATQFEDLYFSDSLGVEETNHVFLQHNNLPERWLNYSSTQFVIAETGFGTGLNFLVTLALYAKLLTQTKIPKFKLIFLSTEKYPLKLSDLVTALQHYPDLNEFSQALIKQYPPNVAGCHRLSFMEGLVTLDLWFGDVHDILPQWQAKQTGIVDAWYLDGFAPSKNPEMWTFNLFEQMVRLAKLNCSFATFTAVGEVRRGLEAAGFSVVKKPGHGKKRHNLAGVLNKKAPLKKPLPYYARPPAKLLASSPRIAIIGSGLAAANCAYALKKRGLHSHIYSRESQLAQGASGNHIGALYPLVHSEVNITSEFNALAYLFALREYKTLSNSPVKFAHQWCGVVQVAFNQNTRERLQKFIDKQAWNDDLVRWVSAEQVSEIAKVALPYEGLFFPDGGWINPPELVNSLVTHAQSELHLKKLVTAIQREGQLWKLVFEDGTTESADIVIAATGSDFANIPPFSFLPLRGVRGQVEYINSTENKVLSQLSTVICHKGYLTPAYQGIHALGSTYIKNEASTDYRIAEQQLNLAMHQKALSEVPWMQQLKVNNIGRAGIRSTSPDHLPLAGALPDVVKQQQQYWDLYKALPDSHYPDPIDSPNIYLLNGLGSRGLTTAPLLAEIIACQICDEPFPLPAAVLNALNPNRFLIRSLIRREI